MPSKRKANKPLKFDQKRRLYEIKETELDTPYSIGTRGSQSFKGNVVKETTYEVQFRPELIGKLVKDMRDLLVKVFTQLLAEAKEDFDGSCMARLFIRHPALNHAVIIAGRTLDTLTVADILAAIDNCVQSEENLDIQESLTIQKFFLGVWGEGVSM